MLRGVIISIACFAIGAFTVLSIALAQSPTPTPTPSASPSASPTSPPQAPATGHAQ